MAGHGWVVPGDMQAKCGGPAHCTKCRLEAFQHDRMDLVDLAFKGLQDASDRHARDASAWARQLKELEDKLAALAEVYGFGGLDGVARDLHDLLAGTGADRNDPRVQARELGLKW